MRRTLILSRRTVRGHHGRFVALALLVLVAAVLLDIAVVSGRQYAANATARADALDTPDVALLVADQIAARALADALSADHRVRLTQTTPVGWRSATIPTKSGTTDALAVYVDLDNQSRLGNWRLLDSAPGRLADGVYVPYLLHASGDYRVGDRFVLGGPAGESAYRIQGFVENPMLGSISLGGLAIGLDHEQFTRRGVVFVEQPREETYGTVAVFEDLHGNLWDLVQPRVARGSEEA